jgi:hypothetical protein
LGVSHRLRLCFNPLYRRCDPGRGRGCYDPSCRKVSAAAATAATATRCGVIDIGAEFGRQVRVGNGFRCIGQRFDDNQLDWLNIIGSQPLPKIELTKAKTYPVHSHGA